MRMRKIGVDHNNLYHELPLEFRMFFEHCHSLPFNGKPNYNHFCHLFDNLLVEEGPQGDVTFDWDVADTKIPE